MLSFGALKRQPRLKIFYRCYSTLRGSCSYHCDVVTVLIYLKYEANISADTPPTPGPGHRWDQSRSCRPGRKLTHRLLASLKTLFYRLLDAHEITSYTACEPAGLLVLVSCSLRTLSLLFTILQEKKNLKGFHSSEKRT